MATNAISFYYIWVGPTCKQKQRLAYIYILYFYILFHHIDAENNYILYQRCN
jgi:hypothetical protein